MTIRWRRMAVSAVLLALAAAAPEPPSPPAPRRAPPTIADFARLPGIEQPVISPDGRHYATKLAIDGKQYLAVGSLEEAGQPKVVGAENVDLNWWRWVNDDWLVVGIGDDAPFEGTHMYITRALGVKSDGKKIVPLAPAGAQRADDLLWIANDGSPRILLSYQTSLYYDNAGFWPEVDEIDVSTGRQRTLVRAQTNVMDWYADGEGAVRMGIGRSNDGRSSQLLYRPGARGTFHVVDRSRSRDDPLTRPALFEKGGQKALVIGENEAGVAALYDLDLATLQRGKQIYASEGFDLAGLFVDQANALPLGVFTEEDRPAIHWLDPNMVAMQASIDGMVRNGTASIVSLSRDRRRAILFVSAPNAPGAYMLFDRASETIALLAYVNPALGMRRLNAVSTIHYRARDGLDISAVLTLPLKRTPKALPLIVVPHGGPFARDSEGWDWWAQFLASRGYAVVQPNYRGSSGFGSRFAKKGEGQWGLAMQDDLDDAVTALAERGIADPKRVCMVGGSYGGYAALRAAERDGARYRCAVSYAGVSDLAGIKSYNSRFLWSGAKTDWLRQQAPNLAAVSPINDAAGFSAPVLLVHGKQDRTVPVQQSRAMASRLRQAGKDVTYIEQPLADHSFSREADRLQFLEALDAFLQKHNPV